MNIDQDYVNIAISSVGVVIGAIVSELWRSMRELQKSDLQIIEKINSIEVLVASDYTSKEDFEHAVDKIMTKLDKIDDKLDAKADKTSCGFIHGSRTL